MVLRNLSSFQPAKLVSPTERDDGIPKIKEHKLQNAVFGNVQRPLFEKGITEARRVAEGNF